MTVELGPTDLAQIADLNDEPADPLEVRDELLWFIEDKIKNHPRSLQRKIGPSEIGHECGRWLGYKLADAPIRNDFYISRDAWRPTVGTAVHAWLADCFESVNPPDALPLFMVERNLHVGSLAPIGDGEPEDVTGSGDLWYRGIAIDWKIVGANTLKKTKAISRVTKMPHGPSERYRKQVHTYGVGWTAMGLPVHTVMIAYLPASGELRSDSFFWHEPYDRSVADQALARVNGTHRLMRGAMTQGPDAVNRVLDMLPTADVYCATCPYFVPGGDQYGGLVKGCPGDPSRYQRPDTLFQIAPPMNNN